MPEPNRKEDSVLTALKELQGIEKDRIEREKEAKRQKIEAEANAQAEIERRAREEEERRKQETVDRARREQEERERAEREGRIRVEESERKARIEAEAKLQAERIRIEAEAAAKAKKIPWGPIGAVIAILVLIAGWAVFASLRTEDEKRKLAEQARIEREQSARKTAEIMADIDASQKSMDELQHKLAQAKSAAEIAEYQNQLARARENANALRARLQNEQQKAKAKEERKKRECANSDDPLCGLNK